ncbi:hypothetical protein TTHERM_000805891 (macronuclear) [Tetrahymena thermophila SB210]|uniref:Uncharacterized protein n=1 Tax=Tetrahymena thermophila (strain SB210) TaxID=312017 RepID=W7XF65_TETTS|nr:hypothetical protein TTHERM_000805891 [Tetrahymena thermophila SB210]EWS75453.1 hypothetical protein TTHERM_000805891 [Tetrahymena thermophila SB210]|eukprot:XP_012652000.1 hypothetical protein TTHERM_000805891 [Tetrahymena thermophila SB210]
MLRAQKLYVTFKMFKNQLIHQNKRKLKLQDFMEILNFQLKQFNHITLILQNCMTQTFISLQIMINQWLLLMGSQYFQFYKVRKVLLKVMYLIMKKANYTYVSSQIVVLYLLHA